MARKVLDDNGVLYLWGKIKSWFVAKEEGKGLSSNDYTDAEKTKLAGIEVHANYYKHPTGAGYSHIPVGGSAGQILRWSAAGTAAWGADKDTTYTAASQVKMGLLTAADKTKLDGIANGAEVNQNAFSTVQVGNSGEFTFSATSKEDKLTITAGTGVNITMDREKKVISINAHAHSNKETLDAITADLWTQLITQSHTHSNKTVLDATTASFTTALLTKLNGIATGANKTTVDAALSGTSTNPVQNKAVNTALAGKLNASARGAKNGVASLDADGRVPSSQLPSYVDDVIEGYYYNEKFYQEEAHTTEITGEGGKIYVDVSTNLSYRYSGSTYVQITSSDMVAITNAEIDAICV